MNNSMMSQIAQWLKEGRDDAEDLVDLPWKVEIEDGTLEAQHPKIPFILYVREDENFIRLRVYTGIETALWNQEERLNITRTLLILNANVDLLKYVLEGLNEEVVLRIDLDKSSFKKKVFEDALVALLTGLYLMVRALKMEEEFSQQLLERVIGMVRERMEAGATRTDIINFLTQTVGLKRNEAEEIVDEIMKSIKKEDLKGYM